MDKIVIILNSIKCNKCFDVVTSKNKNNAISCDCGSVSADGGTDYLQRTGILSNITELSIVRVRDHRFHLVTDLPELKKKYGYEL